MFANLQLPQFELYCLPRHVSQADGLSKNLRVKIMKNCAAVVRLPCIQLMESAIFCQFLPERGCTTACKRGTMTLNFLK